MNKIAWSSKREMCTDNSGSSILVYIVHKIKIVCIYESMVIVVLSMGSNCDR